MPIPAGSPLADTLLGTAEGELLAGEAGDDLIRGLGGEDTLLGGDGADTLTAQLAAATLTGGAGADLFGLVMPDFAGAASDPLASITTITDFDAAEGDLLRLVPASGEVVPVPPPPGTICACITWGFPRTTYEGFLDGPLGYRPLYWTGTATGALAPGLLLPGGDHAELTATGYLTSWLADPSGGGWLLFDLNGDGRLGAGDRVARLDGVAGIGPADFLPGSFRQPILGGAGNDVLNGTGAPDTEVDTRETYGLPFGHVPLAPLDDTLSGGAGDDILRGGAGDDLLLGGTGRDRMHGGTGRDTYHVDDSWDRAIEWAVSTSWYERDLVIASVSYVLGANVEDLQLAEAVTALRGIGNAGDNGLTGNGLDNLLFGRDGNDTLAGGAGRDRLFGEADADRLLGDADADLLDGGEGADTLDGGAGNDLLRGAAGDDLLLARSGGVDTLFGEAGADTLDARAERPASAFGSLLRGGEGNDLYLLDTAGDVVIELAGQGADTIIAEFVATSFTLPRHVEMLRLGFGITEALGNASDNLIEGNQAANRLAGGAGADTLWGAGGNDTLVGGPGADLFLVSAQQGPFGVRQGDDVIADFTPGLDRIGVSGVESYAGYEVPYNRLDFSDLRSAMTDTADGVLLRLGSESVLIAGVAKASLSATDFLFA